MIFPAHQAWEEPVAEKRRKVRDNADARELLREWQHSDLELSDFCEGRGVDGRSLNCWRINLGVRRRSSHGALRLVEVVGTPPARHAAYRVILGDVVVQVDDDFRDDTLARLLRIVVAAC